MRWDSASPLLQPWKISSLFAAPAQERWPLHHLSSKPCWCMEVHQPAEAESSLHSGLWRDLQSGQTQPMWRSEGSERRLEGGFLGQREGQQRAELWASSKEEWEAGLRSGSCSGPWASRLLPSTWICAIFTGGLDPSRPFVTVLALPQKCGKASPFPQYGSNSPDPCTVYSSGKPSCLFQGCTVN